MSRRRRTFGFLRGERGQVLPMVALAAFVLIGFTGLAIDLGRVWVAKQQLQRAVDAATLAAGQDLPDVANANAAADTYSGNESRNPVNGWGVAVGAPTVTFECISSGPDYTKGTSGASPTCLTDSSGNSCHPTGSANPLPSGATTCNAVQISESAKVSTGLLSLFIPSFTVKATSTATARQAGVPNPLDLEVVLDTTQSMTQGCTNSDGTPVTGTGITTPSKLDCAKAGVRTLLQSLDPTNDKVGIVVFPAPSMTLGASPGYSLTANSTAVADETNCSSTESFGVTYPPWQNYTDSGVATNGQLPASALSFSTYNDTLGDGYTGYQVVPFTSGFQTSGTLNVTSPVVEAVDWGETGCPTSPGSDAYGVKDIGGQGSYLAGAISAAQYELGQQPTTNAAGLNVTKAMIVLSDGEMNQPTQCNSGTGGTTGKTCVYHDGVSPGATGNVGWTSTTPCLDALNAATQAKNAGTLIFSIAYNSSGNCGPDTGTGGLTSTPAATLMKELATTGDYIATSGDLTTAFGQAASQLTGNSVLTPDCTPGTNC